MNGIILFTKHLLNARHVQIWITHSCSKGTVLLRKIVSISVGDCFPHISFSAELLVIVNFIVRS